MTDKQIGRLVEVVGRKYKTVEWNGLEGILVGEDMKFTALNEIKDSVKFLNEPKEKPPETKKETPKEPLVGVDSKAMTRKQKEFLHSLLNQQGYNDREKKSAWLSRNNLPERIDEMTQDDASRAIDLLKNKPEKQPKKDVAETAVVDANVEVKKIIETDQKKMKLATEQILIKKADDLDERLIIEEHVEGTEPLVYQIKDKYTPSIAGIFEACRRTGNIKIEDGKLEKEDNKTVGKAWVRDMKNNNVIFGVAERYTNEEYKVTTLINKAIRNALRRAVPKKTLDEVVKEGLEAKSVLIIREL